MEPEDLELMLTEMDISQEDAAEIVEAFPTLTKQSADTPSLHADEMIALEIQNEPDWRKRASMAAAIIKMHLED